MLDSTGKKVSGIHVSVILTCVWIVCYHGHNGTESTLLAGDDRTVQQPQAGAKRVSFFARRAQRNTEAFMDQIRSCEDFDALVAELDEPVATVSGPSGVELASLSSQLTDSPLFFMKVLADRRVARMAGMQENMPPDEAARRAKECYESKLKNLTSMWHEVMDAHVGDADADPSFDLNSYHSVCCALYLCSRFCEPGDVVEMVEDWSSAMEDINARFTSDPRLLGVGGPFLYYGRPDELFLFNIYLSCMQQERALSSEELRDQLKLSMDFVTVPLVAWDAPRTSASIAKQNRKGEFETANDVDRLTFKKSLSFGLRGRGDWLTQKAGMVLRAKISVEGETLENDVEESIIEGKKILDTVEEKASKESPRSE